MRIDLSDGFYLSPIQEGDQAAYVEHFSDKETTDLLLRIPFPYTATDADIWVQSRIKAARQSTSESSFALRRENGFLIGGAGLVLNSGVNIHRAELGYWVAKPYRRLGLATATARALVTYGFEKFGLKRIEATAACLNFPSHRILEKLGFQREGLLTAYHFKGGIYLDVYLYALIAP